MKTVIVTAAVNRGLSVFPRINTRSTGQDSPCVIALTGPRKAMLLLDSQILLVSPVRSNHRANPSPKVTDPLCRLPLPAFSRTRGYSPRGPVAVSVRRVTIRFSRDGKGYTETNMHWSASTAHVLLWSIHPHTPQSYTQHSSASSLPPSRYILSSP